ncbi:DUF6168 family protein [Robertkochia aurantiaca]|uniref:DUF6168 family protein n=1 Tax=Robertkochia aurantiaca TaxID=2873700 RepID=UPI001CCE3FDF|nr:DUF6168 family protein [Robertkochia sp. 3YJGBD-33]
MRKLLLPFYLILLLVLVTGFYLHRNLLYSYNLSPEDLLLFRAYFWNGLLAIVIFTIIYVLRKKLFAQTGFLFMAGSMLKFLMFFLLFYPPYNNDGNLDRTEFITFFIPYALSLVIETIAVSRMLNLEGRS